MKYKNKTKNKTKNRSKKLIRASVAIAIALGYFLLATANAFAAQWSNTTVSNVQIKGDIILISQPYGETFATKDFKTFYTVEAFGESLYGMVALGDKLFFNRGLYCTNDGTTFFKTVVDGKEDHEGLAEVNFWKGIYFGDKWDYESDSNNLYTSRDGINWTKRLSAGDDYFSYYALRDVFFININNYSWDGDRYTTDSNLYITKDFINFTDLGDRYGEPVATYDDTFLISRAYDKNAKSGEEYTYYVCNDGADWRILKMNGSDVNFTSYFTLDGQAKVDIHATLDNALPGQKPFSFYDFDESKNATRHNGASPPEAVSVGGIHTRTALKSYDYISGISSGTLFLSGDGENYNWFMGNAMLQKTASNGKGQFLVSGEHGLYLICDFSEGGSGGSSDAGGGSGSGSGGSRSGGRGDGGDGYVLKVEPHSLNPDGSGIKMLKYIGERYIACTFSGALYTSRDGRNWFGTAALPAAMNDILYSGADQTFYAACDDGIYISRSLYRWERVYASDRKLRSICAGRDRLVAGGENTLIYSYYYTGAGLWMAADAPDLDYETLYGVAYGDGVYIAAGGTGSGGHGIVLRSTDGYSWVGIHDGEDGFEENTNQDICYANCTYSIIYDEGRFMLTGLNRLSDGFDMTSIDGFKWYMLGTYRWGLDMAAVRPGVYVRVKDYAFEVVDGAFEILDANIDFSYDGWSAIAPNRVLETQFEGVPKASAHRRE